MQNISLFSLQHSLSDFTVWTNIRFLLFLVLQKTSKTLLGKLIFFFCTHYWSKMIQKSVKKNY